MKINSLSNPGKMAVLLERFREVCLSGSYAEGAFNRGAASAIAALYGKHLNDDFHVTLTANAGAGLYALSSLLLETGPAKIAVQNNTFYASGSSFADQHEVYLVDSRPDCPSMSLDSLIALCDIVDIEAVVLTHVGGFAAKDYYAIADYCEQHSIVLIEDCAHSFGVMAPVATPGTLGDAAVFSFYPTKAVPIGEGGAVMAKDEKLIAKVARFCNYGKQKDEGGVIRYARGMNLRMSEWDAAVLLTQLDFLKDVLMARFRDASRVAEVFPCLLEGPTNFYKFPVALNCNVRPEAKTGPVYQLSDQLAVALAGRVHTPVSLANSYEWATNHQCVLVGEGLYDNMTDAEVSAFIKG